MSYEIDTSDVLSQFRKSLEDNGFIVNKPIIADGKFHRLPCVGDSWGKTSGAYKLYLDGFPAGYIQNHKNGDGFNWKYSPQKEIKYKPFKPKDNTNTKAKAQEEAIEAEYRKTAEKISFEYETAKKAEDHAYLELKQIKPNDDIKIDRFGNLLIPLRDEEGKLWSVQRITRTGDKFIGATRTAEEKEQGIEYPARKKGCFYTSTPLSKQDEFIICEGYATAKTLEDEFKKATIMAVDAGNLLHVAEKIHKLHPDKPISIYADNDIAKNTNTGLIKAGEVKEKLPKVKVFSPALNKDDVEQRLSDFNDIKVKYGTLKNKIRAVSFSKKLDEKREYKESERER